MAHIAEANVIRPAPPSASLKVIFDWLMVLVRPWSLLGRDRSSAEIAVLIFALLALDLVLMLFYLPSVIDELEKTWAEQPSILQGAKVTSVVTVVAVGTVLNGLVIAACALLLRLTVYLFGAEAKFSSLFANIIIANSTLILERIIRVVISYFNIGLEDWRDLVSLSTIFGITEPSGWLIGLRILNVFDLWFIVLLVIAVYRNSTLDLLRSIIAVSLIWGAYLLAIIRMNMLGFGA